MATQKYEYLNNVARARRDLCAICTNNRIVYRAAS